MAPRREWAQDAHEATALASYMRRSRGLRAGWTGRYLEGMGQTAGKSSRRQLNDRAAGVLSRLGAGAECGAWWVTAWPWGWREFNESVFNACRRTQRAITCRCN